METQGNITETKGLTDDVARHVCEQIMGFEYSHHDNDVCYGKEYGDKHQMIYFYQGMSPSIMKLDTVTGEVLPCHFEAMAHMLYDTMITIQDEMVRLGIEDNKVAEKRGEKVLEFRAKAKEVKKYLIKNKYYDCKRS